MSREVSNERRGSRRNSRTLEGHQNSRGVEEGTSGKGKRRAPPERKKKGIEEGADGGLPEDPAGSGLGGPEWAENRRKLEEIHHRWKNRTAAQQPLFPCHLRHGRDTFSLAVPQRRGQEGWRRAEYCSARPTCTFRLSRGPFLIVQASKIMELCPQRNQRNATLSAPRPRATAPKHPGYAALLAWLEQQQGGCRTLTVSAKGGERSGTDPHP